MSASSAPHARHRSHAAEEADIHSATVGRLR
jgi:hypothetical protein